MDDGADLPQTATWRGEAAALGQRSRIADDAGALVAEAIAAPRTFRVPDYRDRIAAYGTSAVAPLVRAYHEDCELGHFVVTVLSAVAEQGSTAAVDALLEIAATSNDPQLVDFTRGALRRSGPIASSGPSPVPVADPFHDWEELFPSRPTGSVIDRINSVRLRRGEPVLDDAEAAQVEENLRRRAKDPRTYRNVCWHCGAVVAEGSNLHCEECNWLVCWCGACREPNRPWPPTNRAGPCSIEAGYFGQELGYPDVDFRGQPIVCANPPASDAPELREALGRRGLTAVFHWTPARALESIISHGVLSRAELRRAGISVVAHGYGSPEKETFLARYVALAFRPKAVMMKAWSRTPVVLEIDPAVILGAGTLFVPGNSASSAITSDDLPSLEGAAAFERIWPAGQGEPLSQAEAWVRTRLPRRAIRRITVETVELADQLMARLRMARLGYAPPIDVRPDMFAVSSTALPDRMT